MAQDPESQTDNFVFQDPAEHIRFLKVFSVRGVGFSGGEPLLAKERLLSHIAAIRKAFGNQIYLWMYTNGELVDRAVLQQLREAGLNEMRFDLSAREYDLTPVRLAREYLPTVTIEIPAIPEDSLLLQRLLPEMVAIGVGHLNLHQLIAGEKNWRALCRRGYHISADKFPAVYESELTALRLIQYAVETQCPLPINYCSLAYKMRFQERGRRLRRALAARKEMQEVTEAGYLRTLQVVDSVSRIQVLQRRFEQAMPGAGRWQVTPDGRGLLLSGDLLQEVDWTSARLTVTYYRTYHSSTTKSSKTSHADFNIAQNPVATALELGPTAVAMWRKRYLSSRESQRGNESILPPCGLTKQEQKDLDNIARYETMQSSPPALY